ncbi:pre-mRNA-splicing factor syf1 [Entomophthora muscae]|uniref:Pre-mRNA-splicing factor syf1 n=1 Tax=Entomophthora muscae TaxID=34485 RepID=A0ACC2THQ3_9FUNG|nr:pre-mRNA-splicing factor syf1 [Entomophthora muscae]
MVTIDSVNNISNFIAYEDVPYEEEIARNLYSVKSWGRYLDHKQDSLANSKKAHHLRPLFILFERALKDLPGSYKLWKRYLDLRTKYVKEKFSLSEHVEEYAKMNNCFERSLFLLNKMPRIWLDYINFLLLQDQVTKTRRVFDRALRSLPITQHTRIWPLYLLFARQVGGETALRVYKRFIKFDISKIEDYIDLLLELERYDEAAYQLARMLDLDLPSSYGKSPYKLWMELSEIICSHPQDIKRLKVEAILRSGIVRFSDQVGKLWCSLAQYWILLGRFEKARDVFEEAIKQVTTVRDFTQVFDAFAEFEESLLASLIQAGAESGVSELEMDLKFLRFERLMDRRPFLVNEVLLRQNPHNVAEWIKRVELYSGNPGKTVETFGQAIKTIDPKKATPNLLPKIWVLFSRFYEDGGDLDKARSVYEKAVLVAYKTPTELAEVWTEFAELEIRQDNFRGALDVLARATRPPSKYKTISFYDETLPVQNRVFKSLKLWSFYVDLEESVGTLESTRAVYDHILDLKIANPQIIVNYANYLEEQGYHEDSFKIYERGLELFKYPIAFEIWNIYLTKFIQRYGGAKLERARDLFEQAIEHCPAKYAKPIFLLYGKLEEDYGLAKHAMRIYDRATRAVGDNDRLEMFQFYIAKATSAFGVTSTREVYERAIEVLPDQQCKEMCLEYAEMERKLGEIDRARSIYGHASQFCDPSANIPFWQIWHDFEVQHGNEDTFKEMLRIKRSVQAQFNTEINYLSAQILSAKGKSTESGNTGLAGFIKSSQSIKATNTTESTSSAPTGENPDELAI